MKNIKVFIASSAELDEDKTQMDIYFSQKNKSYQRRYIYFEQRTWKDFPSYLSEEHLQSRYDEYIRQCDIVIFLFHTRLGQYTLRELKVAFEELKKRNGKSPKIYIYVKRDDTHTQILETLKQYSEQEYGHFCDTYTDYNELFRHFNYQLEQLEKEGFIRPDPIDIPRTKRFVLFSLLPVLAAALFVLAYQLWQPTSLQFEVTEPVSTRLPFQGGTLILQYADVSQSIAIDRLNHPVEIKGISRRHSWFSPFRIRFEATGYIPIDTVLDFSSHISLPICRNGQAGVLKGMVTDEDRHPVKGAQVKVLEYKVITADDGSFRIDIPLPQQTSSYRMTVTQKGYEIWDYNGVAPSAKEEIQIVLRK